MKTFLRLLAASLLLPVVGAAQTDTNTIGAVIERIESLKAEIEQAKAKRAALEKEIVEATELEAWILASMPLQPLVVEIIRSMGPQSEIVDLAIERDAETPSQLRMHLTLNTASDKQLSETLAVIQSKSYRVFNQTQTRVQGNLDYKASLLYDPNAKGEGRQTPEERAQAREPAP